MLAVIPLALIYILVSCLMACGPINVDAKGNVPASSSDQSSSAAVAAAPAPDEQAASSEPPVAAPAQDERAASSEPPVAAPTPAPVAPAPKAAKAQAPAPVAAEEPATGELEIRDMIYEPRLRAWRDAVEDAPAGHRLATRAEVMELLDLGQFKDLPAHGLPVWTGTPASGEDVYAVALDIGMTLEQGKALTLPAVYVKGTKQ